MAPEGSSGDTNLAVQLGYPAGTKLLIIHADDLGLAHSANRASFEALQAGGVSSGSVMMPCPWVREVAEFVAANPTADVGIHLTLNSEWALTKWGPVASRSEVPSLLDSFGFLLPSVEETLRGLNVEEGGRELKAQIDLALKLGIKPTHLDSHMGTIFRSPGLLEKYLRLGREYGVPVMLVRSWLQMAPALKQLLPPDAILLDGIAMLGPGVAPEGWDEAYAKIIRGLKPGVTELIVHLAFDDEEMRGVSFNHPDFGAAWRERDFRFVMGEAARKALEENQVRLISWREINSKMRQ